MAVCLSVCLQLSFSMGFNLKWTHWLIDSIIVKDGKASFMWWTFWLDVNWDALLIVFFNSDVFLEMVTDCV